LSNILPLVDSVLFTFHLGTMAGPAIADLLLGVTSPSGRLPISFLKTLGQLPVYYNKMNTGRPDLQKYIDVDSEPLFPFGFGLTYSKFTYSNVRLSKSTISSGESLMATVTLKN
jgi:beta-glucosidase